MLFGDGLVLDGTTLYVIENYANQIAVVELAPDLATGQVTQLLTKEMYAFNIPTTAAHWGDALYVVNARFADCRALDCRHARYRLCDLAGATAVTRQMPGLLSIGFILATERTENTEPILSSVFSVRSVRSVFPVANL